MINSNIDDYKKGITTIFDRTVLQGYHWVFCFTIYPSIIGVNLYYSTLLTCTIDIISDMALNRCWTFTVHICRLTIFSRCSSNMNDPLFTPVLEEVRIRTSRSFFSKSIKCAINFRSEKATVSVNREKYLHIDRDYLTRANTRCRHKYVSILRLRQIMVLVDPGTMIIVQEELMRIAL